MAAAAGQAAGSLLGGIAAGKGAKKAAKIQAKSYQAGIDEQHNQFATIQSNNAPYMAAGTSALGGVLDQLGLNGNDAQASAIANLKASPAFTSLYDTGQDTILQNAAATGGLRGGDANNSLAQFGSGLLAQTIQQHLANLGNLVSIGQASTGGTNSAALTTGANVANSLAQQGNANATGAIAPYAAFASTLQGLGNVAGNYFAGGSSGASNAAIYGASPTLQGVTNGTFRGW